MQNIQKRVARRIKELRQAAKLTQSQLAEMAGLSEDTIGALERSKSIPSLDSIEKIALTLKIRLKDFFDFGEEAKEIKEFDSVINELVNYLRGRAIKDVQFTQKFIKMICEWIDNKK